MLKYWEFSGTTYLVSRWFLKRARYTHNLKVVGSNPTPATKKTRQAIDLAGFFLPGVLWSYADRGFGWDEMGARLRSPDWGSRKSPCELNAGLKWRIQNAGKGPVWTLACRCCAAWRPGHPVYRLNRCQTTQAAITRTSCVPIIGNTVPS